MNSPALAKWVPIGTALVAGVAVVGWYVGSNGIELKERIPSVEAVSGAAAIKWDGKLVKGSGAPASLTGLWPQFRGPDRNGISTEKTPLAKSWGESGPKALWKIDVGEGYAGAAIWKGRVYLIDYDREGKADALRCLSLADGQEIWRYTYSVKIKRFHGITRTVPVVTDKYVISLGPKCQLLCVDTETGEFRWQLNLVREFNAQVPEWYAGQCPLVDGDKLILGTGGDALLVAVDCKSGQVLWKSPNPNNWQMTHSSLVATEFKGKKMYVYCASGGVAGVSATDGAILWSTPDWRVSIANVPSPVPVGDGRFFFCGGYKAGCMMLQLKEAGDKFTTETIFKLPATQFGATQHTPILFQDHLFGARDDGQFFCLDLNGKVTWASGAAHRFGEGKGPFLIAQDLLYVLDDNGTLVLLEASPAGFKQLASAKVLEGPDAWGPMALADGRLIVRDLNKMVCLDVAGK